MSLLLCHATPLSLIIFFALETSLSTVNSEIQTLLITIESYLNDLNFPLFYVQFLDAIISEVIFFFFVERMQLGHVLKSTFKHVF